MKIPFCVSGYYPCPLGRRFFQELHCDGYETEIRWFSQSKEALTPWVAKEVPVRLFLGPKTLIVETWEKKALFPFPLSYNTFKEKWECLRRQTYYTFLRYGLCGTTLHDPAGRRHILRQKEALVLAHLMEKGFGSKTILMQEVWGYHPSTTTHTLESHFSDLRNKLQHAHPPLAIECKEGKYILSKEQID